MNSLYKDGFFGEYGGAFVPELLQSNILELQSRYKDIITSDSFKQEYLQLLKDYVGRPTPLYLSEHLSKKFNARIFLKREDLNHTGAHKINNTIGQILLAKAMGKTLIIAETGAGQHGVATATVCAFLGMECRVYMGEKDIERQAPNVGRMKLLGAQVIPATSGSKTLKDATNEAIRAWIQLPENGYYLIGSTVGPAPYPAMVAEFQSIISEEIKKQMIEKTGSPLPDHVVACVGGGSNAAGAFYHFIDHEEVRLHLAEAGGLGVNTDMTAATGSLGTDGILHGSKSLMLQDVNGQVIEPHSISAGLDYPGIGPMHAHLIKSGRANIIAVTDQEAIQAGIELTRNEGIIPALESAHALAALKHIELAPNESVVLNLSGRGDKDLSTYLNYC